jgi:putative tricarboxylic transport membrane protein
MIVGLFGISEVLANLERQEFLPLVTGKVLRLLPSLKDWRDAIGAILRGWGVGFFYGLLPGGGATVSSIISYSLEKRVAKHPEEFGRGAVQGLAGPESANNAAATSAFIPLLTMGIPTTGTMAIILAALMLHGITPGPLMISNNPTIFWGVLASMYIGNVLLLFINLPMIGLWIRVLKIPYAYLFVSIILFCLIGAMAIDNSVADVFTLVFFGVLGFLMNKFRYEAAPLLFSFILGPIFEDNLRRALIVSDGSFAVFFNRPICLLFFVLSFLVLTFPFLSGAFSRLRRQGRTT